MLMNRKTIVSLAAIFFCALAAVGRASAGLDEGGHLAEPPSERWQTWSKDARVVFSANLVLRWYAELPDEAKGKLARQAQSIAKRRRAAIAWLIQNDPQQALWLSLAPGQRQGLPKFIMDELESRVHAVGNFSLAITETLLTEPGNAPQDGFVLSDLLPQQSVTSWAVSIGEVTRQAFVHGIRLDHQTKFDTPIHGIVLGDRMAVSEQQLYQYDLFETVQLGFKPEQIVATSGGLPIPLPDITAFIDLEQELRSRLLRFGPLPLPANQNEWTTGLKRVLVLKAQYRGDPRETPYSDGEITAWIGGANTFFQENSQNRTSFNTTIVSAPYPVLPVETYRDASSEEIGHAILAGSAISSARAFGFDPDSYDRIIILAPQLSDAPKSTARIGGKAVVVTSDVTGDLRTTLAHELGHTYGFAHSTFLSPFDSTDPSGPGESLEYGDAWDMMGGPGVDDTESNPQRRHFNAFYKALAGWLPAPNVADGSPGGTFRLHAHDSADAVGLRAVFVDVGGGTVYWLGRRAQFPWNDPMANGIEVRRVSGFSSSGYRAVELLDMPQNAGIPNGSVYHSLASPRAFNDSTNGVTIRVGSEIREDALGEYLEVFVTRF